MCATRSEALGEAGTFEARARGGKTVRIEREPPEYVSLNTVTIGSGAQDSSRTPSSAAGQVNREVSHRVDGMSH